MIKWVKGGSIPNDLSSLYNRVKRTGYTYKGSYGRKVMANGYTETKITIMVGMNKVNSLQDIRKVLKGV